MPLHDFLPECRTLPPLQPKPACSSDVPFAYLAEAMTRIARAPTRKKDAPLVAFLKACVPRPSPDLFQIFRFLLPGEDLDRRVYGLKEERLAALLVDAAGLSKTSPDAQQALKWKRASHYAGHFAGVLHNYVLRKACAVAAQRRGPGPTVGDVNSALGQLATAEDHTARVKLLGGLMSRCTAGEMFWVVRVILKDVKLGVGKERLLRALHPDALDLLNTTTDLARVCRELADPAARLARRDIEPGCCVKAQLAARCNSVEDAALRLKGRPFSVEVHKMGNECRYFSRRSREHGELSSYDVLDHVIQQQVKPRQAILDGELVVWNKRRGVFELFGGIRHSINAAKEGRPEEEVVKQSWQGHTFTTDAYYEHPQAGDIELLFVAFDLLFDGEESLISRPLRERQQRLAGAIHALPADQPGLPLGEKGTIRGRIVSMLPDVLMPMPTLPPAAPDATAGEQQPEQQQQSAPAVPTSAQGMVCCRNGSSLAVMQEMYDFALSRQEEGVVVKLLDSPWKPDDRSGAWLKIKPDYIKDAEIDAVIIACYYGGGRRGGSCSEFLLGLLEGGGATGLPSRWCSFCKVGTGMSMMELRQINERLSPYLIPGSSKPPAIYRVSGKEKPDFWVVNPEKSIVMEVHSDIRSITSRVYACEHSLRFPRVSRLRWDKGADSVTHYAELKAIVDANGGHLADIKRNLALGVPVGGKSLRSKHKKQKAARRRGYRPLMVAAAALPDVRDIQPVDELLAGKTVYFESFAPPGASDADKAAAKQELAAMVVRHGGVLVASAQQEVDYVFAAALSAQRDWARVDANRPWAARDIVGVDWLRQVDAAGELLPIMPRHRLFLRSKTRQQLQQEGRHDRDSNPFYEEVDAQDMASLLQRLVTANETAAYRQQLEANERLLLRAEEAADALEPAPVATASQPAGESLVALLGIQSEGAAAGGATGAGATPQTLRSLVLGVQHQLQVSAGCKASPAMLFAGCCLLFIPYPFSNPGASTGVTASLEAAAGAGAQPLQQQQQQLMESAVQAVKVAASWQLLLQQQELCDVKLAVMLHGGEVAETYGPSVTHLVMWPLHQQQLQQQDSAEAARRPCLLEAAPRAAAGSAAVQPPGSMVVQLSCTGQEQLPGQGVTIDPQLLLQQLAAIAEEAADVAAEAAASARLGAASGAGAGGVSGGGASGGGGGSRLALAGRGRSKLSVAAPPAAVERSGGGRGSQVWFSQTQSSAMSQRQGAASSGAASGSPAAAGGPAALSGPITALTRRLAAGGPSSSSSALQQVLAEQQAAEALSPAALRLLRQMRRRLAAAAASAAGSSPAGGAGTRQFKVVTALHLVTAGWVVDSLKDLQPQQQVAAESQAANPLLVAGGLATRRSELLYRPQVTAPPAPAQQQQQQLQDGGQQAAEAAAGAGQDGPAAAPEGAAAGPAAPLVGPEAGLSADSYNVLEWPWSGLGLAVAGAGGSSSDDGHSSSDASDRPATKRRKNAKSPAADDPAAAAAAGAGKARGRGRKQAASDPGTGSKPAAGRGRKKVPAAAAAAATAGGKSRRGAGSKTTAAAAAGGPGRARKRGRGVSSVDDLDSGGASELECSEMAAAAASESARDRLSDGDGDGGAEGDWEPDSDDPLLLAAAAAAEEAAAGGAAPRPSPSSHQQQQQQQPARGARSRSAGSRRLPKRGAAAASQSAAAAVSSQVWEELVTPQTEEEVSVAAGAVEAPSLLAQGARKLQLPRWGQPPPPLAPLPQQVLASSLPPAASAAPAAAAPAAAAGVNTVAGAAAPARATVLRRAFQQFLADSDDEGEGQQAAAAANSLAAPAPPPFAVAGVGAASSAAGGGAAREPTAPHQQQQQQLVPPPVAVVAVGTGPAAAAAAAPPPAGGKKSLKEAMAQLKQIQWE